MGSVFISPTASPHLRPRRASRMWGWVGEVVRIYYTYRLVGVCVCVCVWSGLCPTSDCPTWDSPDPTEPARVPLARALSRWCCCCGRRARACAPTRACALCRVAQAPGQGLVVADPLGLVMPARCRGGAQAVPVPAQGARPTVPVPALRGQAQAKQPSCISPAQPSAKS